MLRKIGLAVPSAFIVAMCALAFAGTSSAASAACSDVAYLKAEGRYLDLDRSAHKAAHSRNFGVARAQAREAFMLMHSGPVPCDRYLRQAWKHTVYASTYMRWEMDALSLRDYAAATSWIHKQDIELMAGEIQERMYVNRP